jgi:photosystem II stability/assembly factor-like uncharacterized protein
MKGFVSAALLLAVQLCLAGEWRHTGPYGGSALAVAIDPSQPDTMYLGARNSLIYKSDDGGSNWRRLPFPRHFLGSVQAILVDPSDSKRIFAAVLADGSPYGGIWRSADGGQSWSLCEDTKGSSGQALTVWARDPKRMAAGTKQGIWLTTNGGDSWERISRPFNHEMRFITAVAIDPGNPEIIYAGTPHLPWKTTDSGKSWSHIHEGMLDDSDVFSLFIDPANPEKVLASACSGIYRSEDAGAKWSKFAGIPGTHRRTHAIRLHPEKKSWIYAGTTLGLLRSTDGGASFKQMNQLHILSMAFHPNNPDVLYMATENSGLWRSEDAGVTAVPLNEGFTSRKVTGITEAGGRLWTNTVQDGNAGGVYVSEDGGSSWKLAASGGVLGENHIYHVAAHPAKPEIVLAANQKRLLRSLDAGKKWKDVPLPPGSSGTKIQDLKASDGETASFWLATDHGLYRSADGTAPWKLVVLAQVNKNPSVLSVMVAGDRILARTSQALYLSEDAGVSWKPLGLLISTGLVYDIALSPTKGGPLLLATAQGMMGSADLGKTWTKRTTGLEPGTVTTVRFEPDGDRAWAVQFGRLYSTSDGGWNWNRLEGGEIPGSNIQGLWNDPGKPERLYAVTPDLGVFYLELQ